MFLRPRQWITGLVIGLLERILLGALAAGPLPRHIAFVMDGNRRYAGRKGQRPEEGHVAGFSALRRVLELCLRLGIGCVSVYAFSIENFQRSAGEVDALMDLCAAKLDELCAQGDLLEKYGVRLQVLGRRELLPAHVQAAAERAERMTAGHDQAILNVLMPYTSRDEMTAAVAATVERVQAGSLDARMITEAEIEAELYTRGSPRVEVLVRTSGVRRLSDFMLWQSSEGVQIHFAGAYWPDMGLRELVPILVDYQRKVWGL